MFYALLGGLLVRCSNLLDECYLETDKEYIFFQRASKKHQLT